MKHLYDFLYFSSGNMSFYRQFKDCGFEVPLSSGDRLARKENAENVKNIGRWRFYGLLQKHCFSYSSKHEYCHVCYDTDFPNFMVYEIEVLDYDRRVRYGS